MNNNINGLLTMKPDRPAPVVGEKRRFSVTEKERKNGKPWNKIKSEGEGYGRLYEVVSVQKTDFTDAHGNVSYNLRIVSAAENPTSTNGKSNGHAPAPDANRSARIERQHSQEMALRYLAIKGEVPKTWGDFCDITDRFQRDIGREPVKHDEPEPQTSEFQL